MKGKIKKIIFFSLLCTMLFGATITASAAHTGLGCRWVDTGGYSFCKTCDHKCKKYVCAFDDSMPAHYRCEHGHNR
jgi:hypothetical protein